MFDFHQAFTTETVCIAVCDVILFRIIKGDTVALAGGYIAHLTFEGGITTGTGFYFVARHMAMMQKYYLQAIPDPYLKLYRDARKRCGHPGIVFRKPQATIHFVLPLLQLVPCFLKPLLFRSSRGS